MFPQGLLRMQGPPQGPPLLHLPWPACVWELWVCLPGQGLGWGDRTVCESCSDPILGQRGMVGSGFPRGCMEPW